MIVIAELMGIPAADRDRFKQWSDVIVSQTRPGADESGHMAAQPGNGGVLHGHDRAAAAPAGQ